MEAMAALSSSAATLLLHTTPKFSSNPLLRCSLTAPSNPSKRFNSNFTTSILFHPNSCIIFPPTRRNTNAASSSTSTTSTTTTSSSTDRRHWIVVVKPPPQPSISRPEAVNYYVKTLQRVLGRWGEFLSTGLLEWSHQESESSQRHSEKDAQMCIYHISWQSNYGFCCEVDDECDKELADVSGVLSSVHADENVESDNKDYGGGNHQQSTNATDLSATNPPAAVKTKKLFVTGLSFSTSEKTLRAAFEGFGELVEVKIIMDKISKRSKGFAFIEYTTVEAASAALKEMNGKIINGWMIVVDVAKTNPLKYSRGLPRPSI